MRFTLLFALLSLAAQAQNIIINAAPAGNVATTPARARQILATEQSQRLNAGDHGFYAYELAAKRYTYNVVRENWGSATYAPVHFVAIPPLAPNTRTKQFLETLELQKGALMDYFGLSNQEYNKIALMGLGILGNESEFFTNWRYHVKSFLPDAALGFIRGILRGENMNSPRSHGGIQMKEMPDSVRQVFDAWATNGDLRRPEISAVAVVIFMHNARLQLLRMARTANNNRINATNVWDYVPYIYMGSGRKITGLLALPATTNLASLSESQRNEIAIPATNAYVTKLRGNMMKFLMLESTEF
jgi:hypothetical protein